MKKKKIIFLIFLVLACLVGIREIALYFFPYYHHPTRSMAPTIPPNSSVVGSRIQYITGNPERFDLVIFHPPETSYSNGKQSWIKRVYGLPGEKIEVGKGRVKIDGVAITIPENLAYKGAETLRKPIAKFKLSDSEYFLIGDNFDNSRDSRHLGAIKRNDIFAKVIKIMPPSDLPDKAEQNAAEQPATAPQSKSK